MLAQERLHREWYEITGGSGRAEDALFAQGMRSRRMFENIDKLEHRLTKYEKKEQEKMLVAKEVGVHLEAARAGLRAYAALANARVHGIGPSSRVLLCAAASFDPCIGEAWTALLGTPVRRLGTGRARGSRCTPR